MAKCPKCGAKISPFNWKQTCEQCGVNLCYYDMEARLEADAEKAEREFANLDRFVNHLKSATIGSVLTILRLVCVFLPIAAVFLPLAKVTVTLPFADVGAHTVNALTAVKYLIGMDFGALFGLFGSAVAGTAAKLFLASAALMAVVLVMMVLMLLFVAFSYRKYGNVRNLIFCGIALVCALVSGVLFAQFLAQGAAAGLPILSGSLGVGYYVTLVTLAAYFILNVLVVRAQGKQRAQVD